MKYKVGDRVKCKEFGEGVIKFVDLGDVSLPYKVRFNKAELWCEESKLKLTKAKQFTKNDLKDGDILTYRDGTKAIYVCNALVGKNGVLRYVNSYEEDLTRGDQYCKDTDIVKVERPTENLNTVFERKEEILNKAEKKYLSDVIRPWRDEVRGIVKEKLNEKYWISIDFKNYACMDFPNLKNKDDYKNMEAGKMYSLEELEL